MKPPFSLPPPSSIRLLTESAPAVFAQEDENYEEDLSVMDDTADYSVDDCDEKMLISKGKLQVSCVFFIIIFYLTQIYRKKKKFCQVL